MYTAETCLISVDNSSLYKDVSRCDRGAGGNVRPRAAGAPNRGMEKYYKENQMCVIVHEHGPDKLTWVEGIISNDSRTVYLLITC